MTSFIIRFLLCNLLIGLFIGILLAVKHLLQSRLSGRMQYHLWFLLLIVLAVPLLPALPVQFHPARLSADLLLWQSEPHPFETLTPQTTDAANWLNDFAVSVSRDTSSAAGALLFGIWITGIFVMVLITLKSNICFYRIRKSALPLQNPEIRNLYQSCLAELKLSKDIPIYSTAFLKSPVSAGLLRPCIYLPIHLISGFTNADSGCADSAFFNADSGCADSAFLNADSRRTDSAFRKKDLRYMLLHELQHYKHRDAFPNFLMNLALLFYWFHPLVWLASREMRCDREIACDASVLKLLPEQDYTDYGQTLLRFARCCSHVPFPFAAGFHNGMYQMKRRILKIAAYRKPSAARKAQSIAAFLLIALLMLSFAPALIPFAADDSHFYWNESSHNIFHIDASAYFGEFEGSLVLYDSDTDVWTVYNPQQALTRVSPNSTYKIYDALFGLDAGIITPEHSLQTWDGYVYPFAAWNQDQTLSSALQNSVNWYFHSIDRRLGSALVSRYLKNIGYGNEALGRDLDSYWMESDLKISPVEQVLLLTELCRGALPFAPEHTAAVLDGIAIPDSELGALYGKTGTGNVNGKDVNGWFIGYVEAYGKDRHTIFFAVNIQGEDHANGSTAAKLLEAYLTAELNTDSTQR